jgi:hypothetical protein
LVVYVLNFHGQELQGTIWGDHQGIKKPIFLPFQANILLEMALCVMK